jgi:hypothetical protein
VQAGLRLQHFAHFHAVKLLVALGARAPDGRAARGVEQAELDADGIGDLAHDAAESVHFADEMPLGDAADGGIATHLGDQVEVHGDERGFKAHARRAHCRFAAGVTCAYHHHIVLFRKSHLWLFYGSAGLSALSRQLSALSLQLSALSRQLSALSLQLSAVSLGFGWASV